MPINRDNLDEFTTAYIEAALWSSTGDYKGDCAMCDATDVLLTGMAIDASELVGDVCQECRDNYPTETTDRNEYPPLDKYYGVADIAEETLARMVADCDAFQVAHGELLTDDNLTHGPGEYNATERAGHDFWLTRNGHGCGFWDGDWIEPAASTLDAASKAAGEVNLYVGDDGRIYA